MAQTQPTTALIGSRRVALLAAGDAIAFLVFSAIGRSSHGEAAGLQALLQVANTAAPFLLGWYLVAAFTGVYQPAATATPQQMLQRTAWTWFLACPVGLLLRAIYLQRDIPFSFALVTFVTHALIMLLWRGGFSLIERRRV